MPQLTGLAALVDRDQVLARLSERAPRADTATVDGGLDLIDLAIASVASEVTSITGTGLADQPGPKRDLAVTAIVYGVSMEVEADLYPEQGRAEWLRQRYAELLERLRGYVDPAEDGNGDGVPAPIGSFPPPAYYPDAAYRPVYGSLDGPARPYPYSW